MNKRYIYYFLLLLLFSDIIFSFTQHYSMPLDGDMADGIIPNEDVNLILKDPFGISVIIKNTIYSNPNRFFAHWSFFNYFNYVPIWLQNFTNPIESVYLACAIAKIFIQVSIMTLLALYITGKQKIFDVEFLTVAILITPLFQINGYRSNMGIIDPSITYTFFYALPCTLLLLFYLPFYSDSVNHTSLLNKKRIKLLLFLLGIIIVFNGALDPGVILIITLLFVLNCYFKTAVNLTFGKKNQAFLISSMTHLLFFIFISILSLYALYIGKNNAIFLGETISIGERYSRIPIGIYNIATQNIGYQMLFFFIGMNLVILYRNYYDSETKQTLRMFGWIGLFAIIYILLLPLGGYKGYRPNILRYDTIMPITIGFIFIYAKSSYQLLKYLKGKFKIIYIISLIIFLCKLTIADKPEINNNDHEKLALEKISKSNKKVVFIEDNCTIISWEKIADPRKSASIGQLLKRWKITSDNKEFYQNENIK
jgi:hypothetical protein